MVEKFFAVWVKMSLSAAMVSMLLSCSGSEDREKVTMQAIEPPVAAKRPKQLEAHNHTRIDNYYWIRDDERKDPDVLALLAEENSYTRKVMAHTEGLQRALFTEITARLKDDDQSAPIKRGDYWYWREFRQGGEYPVYVRRSVSASSAAEVMLDANKLAEGHEYFAIGGWAVSSDQDVLAYADDTVSRRLYTIRFKDLATGDLYSDEIPNTSASLAWANDNKTLYYVVRHPQTLLPYQVYRHRLGDDPADDLLVYEEADDTFYTRVYKTRSKQFVVIFMGSTLSTEVILIDADDPSSAPVKFLAREDVHEYEIRHLGDTFYIRTNWQAENFRLMKAKADRFSDKTDWEEVIPNRVDVLLADVEVFENYLVFNEISGGLPHIRMIHLPSGDERKLDFPEPAYSASLHVNADIDTTALRYSYASLTTPNSIYELDMESGDRKLVKRDEVVGRFDPADYATERLYATVRDGTKVPISLVYRKGFKRHDNSPLYVYGYGSYGSSMHPTFRSSRLTLLDRGFVYAIIHVRGGEEMGRAWYENGKMLFKKNTFLDFIDSTEYLLENGYGGRDKVFAAGGSAGGLLMGVIANEAPELFKGIIAHVPFVDVVTTMLDESIPLTTGEFDEWGDPKIKEYYDYMLSYSPYDQVKAQDYPNILVTTGLHDSQVQYFEPVKWVSKLRALKTDDNLLLMDINMETGHGGASGRYEHYRIDALEDAFMLDLIGIAE
tara:strand:+ start:13367 stop:15532 length:2166 start_codon:yes stop_codon:yes gene_type:complete